MEFRAKKAQSFANIATIYTAITGAILLFDTIFYDDIWQWRNHFFLNLSSKGFCKVLACAKRL